MVGGKTTDRFGDQLAVGKTGGDGAKFRAVRGDIIYLLPVGKLIWRETVAGGGFVGEGG